MSSTFGNLDNTVEIRLSGTRLFTSGFDRPFSLSSEKRLKISGGGSGYVQIFADLNSNGVIEDGIDVILAQQSLDVLASNPIAQNFNPGNYIFRAASFDVQTEAPYQINLQVNPSDYLFDANYYRSVNPDLAGMSDQQAFDHFAEYGLKELRQFSPYVDLAVYAASNPDLRAVGLISAEQLYNHLVNYGVGEGRIFSNKFNAGFYRNNYADLAAAGFNNKQLFDHFRNFGVAEGRLGVAPTTPPVPPIPPNPVPNTTRNFPISSVEPVIPQSSQTTNTQPTIEFITTKSEVPVETKAQVPVETETPQNQPKPTPGIDPVTGMSFEERVVELTNQFRAENGLAPLTLNTQLTNAAETHSKNMASQDFFSHTGLDGSQPSDRAQSAGYSSQFVGENIGAGYTSPEKAVEGWKKSPGHRANMLKPEYTEIGVGYFYLENDTGSINRNHYWTQVFGAPADSFL